MDETPANTDVRQPPSAARRAHDGQADAPNVAGGTDASSKSAASAPAGADDDKDAGTDPRIVAEKEYGGPSGPEPTRYGDWERKGRCIDF